LRAALLAASRECAGGSFGVKVIRSGQSPCAMPCMDQKCLLPERKFSLALPGGLVKPLVPGDSKCDRLDACLSILGPEACFQERSDVGGFFSFPDYSLQQFFHRVLRKIRRLITKYFNFFESFGNPLQLTVGEKKRWSGLEFRNSTSEIRKKSEIRRRNRALPTQLAIRPQKNCLKIFNPIAGSIPTFLRRELRRMA
jgi:hypothetical protein